MAPRHDDLPPELRQLASELEDQRPALAEHELQRVRRRAMTVRTDQGETTTMRSRLAITAALALGLLMTGGGAAMGVSALTSSNNASIAQYGTTTTTSTTTTTTSTTTGAPITPASTPPAATVLSGSSPPPSSDVLDETDAGEEPIADEADTEDVQAARQAAAAEDEELPFTGYAALPLLLLGLALLATGLVLRRRAAGDTGT